MQCPNKNIRLGEWDSNTANLGERPASPKTDDDPVMKQLATVLKETVQLAGETMLYIACCSWAMATVKGPIS